MRNRTRELGGGSSYYFIIKHAIYYKGYLPEEYFSIRTLKINYCNYIKIKYEE